MIIAFAAVRKKNNQFVLLPTFECRLSLKAHRDYTIRCSVQKTDIAIAAATEKLQTPRVNIL